jgi:hypothetical protein|tara:strand:- start:1631 stop:2155 length:525 start_codon:yes stop_codon:yes gene_type:complete
MTFSFREIDLNEVVAQKESSGTILKKGDYICKVSQAEVRPTRSGGSQVMVELKDVESGGVIKDFINIHLPVSESMSGDEKTNKLNAQKWGREKLKALLTHGGHSNPDKPGDIVTLVGLNVGVHVEPDSYTDSTGTQREGSRVKRFGAYYKVVLPMTTDDASKNGADTEEDIIPF